MPGDSKEYRQYAARCLELAAETANEGAKQMLLRLAKVWETLAAELEHTKRILDDEDGAIKLGKSRRRQGRSAKSKRRKPLKTRKRRKAGVIRAKQPLSLSDWMFH